MWLKIVMRDEFAAKTYALQPLPTVKFPENVAEFENVFAPAIVCVPVVTNPRAVALASGKLNVCILPELTILKSVPVVPG